MGAHAQTAACCGATARAPAPSGAAVVQECGDRFFADARTQYGWSPEDVVNYINHQDGDPNTNVADIGARALREDIAAGKYLIYDQSAGPYSQDCSLLD